MGGLKKAEDRPRPPPSSGGGRGGLLDAIQGHGGVGGLKKVDRSALEQKPVAAEPSNPMAAALAKALEGRRGAVANNGGSSSDDDWDDDDDDDDW